MSHLSQTLGSQAAAPRKSVLRRWSSAIRCIAEWMAIAGIASLSVPIVMVGIDVIYRRLLGGSVVGVVDVTQLFVMAAAFWSIPLAFCTGAHVSVDFLSFDRRPILRRTILAISAAAALGLIGLLFSLSLTNAAAAWAARDMSQDIGVPMVIYWAFLLSGFAIAIPAALVPLVDDLCGPNEEKQDA